MFLCELSENICLFRFKGVYILSLGIFLGIFLRGVGGGGWRYLQLAQLRYNKSLHTSSCVLFQKYNICLFERGGGESLPPM